MSTGRMRLALAVLSVTGLFVATPAERSDAQIGVLAPANPGMAPPGQSPADAITSEEPPGPVTPIAPAAQVAPYSGAVPASLLIRVPVSGIVPGDVAVAPPIRNPLENDPDAAARGMRD